MVGSTAVAPYCHERAPYTVLTDLERFLPAALRTCGAGGNRGWRFSSCLLIPFIIMGSSHFVFTPVLQFHLNVLKTSQNPEFKYDLPPPPHPQRKPKQFPFFPSPYPPPLPPSLFPPPLTPPPPPDFSISVKDIFTLLTTQTKTFGFCPLPFNPDSLDVTKTKIRSHSGPFLHPDSSCLTVPPSGTVLPSPRPFLSSLML